VFSNLILMYLISLVGADCPKGTFLSRPKEGSESVLCVECGEGHFSWRVNSSKCDQCPAGSTSNNEHTTCVPCVAGTFGNNDGGGCKRCPEGEFTNSARKVKCEVCPAGTTSNSANTECVDCPIGRFSHSKNEGCFDCDVGKYSNTRGSEYCQECPGTDGECDPKTGKPTNGNNVFVDVMGPE
jgi:hypothetical protein